MYERCRWKPKPRIIIKKEKAARHKFPFMAWPLQMFHPLEPVFESVFCHAPESRCKLDGVLIRWRELWAESAVVTRLQVWFSAEFYRFRVLCNQIAHPEIRTTAQLMRSAAPSLPLTEHIFHILFMLTPLSHCLLWGFFCQKGEVWPAATMIISSPCKPDTTWTTIKLVFVSTVLRDDKAVY